MLFELLDILSLELSMLVVAVRLLKRNGDTVKYVRGLLEDVIHLLKRAVSCLWVEEIDNREDASVSVEYQFVLISSNRS